MNLTTVDRVREAMGISLTMLDTELDNALRHIITGTSSHIEKSPVFDRYIERKQRTEDFNVINRQKIFNVKGAPIFSTPAPLVYNDTNREFDSTTLIDASDYGINYARGIFTFDNYDLMAGSGILRIIYTGGLGLHTDRMIVTCVAGGTGSFTASEVITGQTSGARGKFVSLSADTLTISVLSGEFITNEIVKGDTSNTVRTISAITQTPIVMAYPDIAYACELQSMFVYKRRDLIGLGSASMAGGSIAIPKALQLLDEVQEILSCYRIY